MTTAHRAVVNDFVRISEFKQFPTVSGLVIELTEFEAEVGKFLVRCVFQFDFIAAEHAPYIFRRLAQVSVFGVDNPCRPAVWREEAQFNAFTGVRISDEKRMLVALVDSDGLDGDLGVGCGVICGELGHFFSFRLVRLLDALMIQ